MVFQIRDPAVVSRTNALNDIFVLAGFYLGENWHVAEQYAGIFSRIVVVTVAVLIAWWVLKRVLRNRRGLSDSARRERGQQ